MMHRQLPPGIVWMTAVEVVTVVRLGRNSRRNIGEQEIIQPPLPL